MKINCLSLNPSLSYNHLGDEGLLQLFRFLPNLKMLSSLKWVAPVSPHSWMVFLWEYWLWKHSPHLGRSFQDQVQLCSVSVEGRPTVLSGLSPPIVQNSLTPLEVWLRSGPKSLSIQSSMKETGGLVCRCGTWFLKQAGVFSRPLNFSSPGSSSGGRAVLPLLRWALLEDKCWGAPASAVESEFSHHGGLCLSGYFTWYSHCKCTVQDCGLRSIAPFCFIERDIYCSCLINGTQAKTVPVTDNLQLLLRSVQWKVSYLSGFFSQHQAHCPWSH